MNYLLKNYCGHTKRVMLLLAMFVCLSNISAIAQEVISGKITSNTGEALIGVTVTVQGTNDGTATDFDGNFSLTAASDAVLDISYIGYKLSLIHI